LRRALATWGPVLAWGGLLSFLASRPAESLPRLPWGLPGMDKLVHAALYAPLGFLTQRALGLPRLWAAGLAGAFVGLGWGAFDEWLQSGAAGREPDGMDVVADAVGAAAGAGAAWFLRLGRPGGRNVGYH
jgi:VanZ family protein